MFKSIMIRALWCVPCLTIACLAIGKENAKAEALFENIFQQGVERSPIFQTSIGLKTDYHRWDDMSERFALQGHRLKQIQLDKLRALDSNKLNPENQLSLRILQESLTRDITFFQWRHHNYVFHQMGGMHTQIVSLLMNQHKVASVSDAEAYISRIKAVPTLFDQLLAGQATRAEKGIIPPAFVVQMAIESSANIVKGQPFQKNAKEDSALFEDIKAKIRSLDIASNEQKRLLESATHSLTHALEPAYKKLIRELKALKKLAKDKNVGAWRFPKGVDYYAAALQRTTTTELSAEEIHQLGLDEVARIHNEMLGIMKQVAFKGKLQDFFQFMRTDKQFYYADSEQGRNQYLDDAVALVAEIKKILPKIFVSEAKTDLLVKRVEAYREKSAGMAFYQPGAPDGSRPGIFYANLSNMRAIPNYEMAALVYHEGLPGHHMQISIARELQNIPSFRKYGRYTAYVEGWGLYSELLPKELGLYQDPYSDFGRLGLELWRACRLVVDTGIHHFKWPRDKAIQYLMENTPAAEARVERSIDRYIVIPSQATAYKIGMLKILELREKAKKAMGDKFELREFHEQILGSGAIPLNVMEDKIVQWMKKPL